MGSSGGTSEIVEAKEPNFVHNSDRSNAQNYNLKVDERGGKSRDNTAEDDFNRLIKAIDLRTSSRVVGLSRQMCADNVWKNTLKSPVTASGIGISESVTLKQALRKLCISQASEMAAIKRVSKSFEAGTIKKRSSSVVLQPSDYGLTPDEGRGNLVEISFVPEKTTVDSSEKATELSNKIVVSSSHHALANKAGVLKTSIRDVITSTDVEDDLSIVGTIGTKGKAVSQTYLSSSLRVAESSKSRVSPRLIKTYLKKKGKQGPTLTPGSSSRCVVTSPNGDKGMRNKGNDETKADVTPNSCNGGKPLGEKTSESSRSREKGEYSQSSKSSIGDYSSSTSISDESRQSGASGNCSRPHMSRDVRWIAIRQVIVLHGSLGLQNFKLLKRLGCGDIGTVYLAELIGSECLFALKVMDIEYLVSRKKMLRAQTEREILQMLDHPFLPTLYAHFTTDNLSCLVMEYCPGGDLHVLRQKQPSRSFSEPAARFYVAEVLLALEYLHMLGVVYRDLKPENILVREDGHIMLSDFDLSLRCTVSPTLLRLCSSGTQEPSKKLSGPCAENSCIDPLCLQPSWVNASCFTPRLVSSTMAKTRKLKADPSGQVSSLPQVVVEPIEARSNSFVGTHEYLAPEIIRGDGHGSAVDWWTFGIFLYELLFGRTPFKGPGNEETLANVVSECLQFPESPTVSFHARDLIRGLLIKEPENRLGSVRGAAEIKQHIFFEGLNWALIRCAPPPDTPRNYDVGTTVAVHKKKEGKCLDFRPNGEDMEFDLF